MVRSVANSEQTRATMIDDLLKNNVYLYTDTSDYTIFPDIIDLALPLLEDRLVDSVDVVSNNGMEIFNIETTPDISLAQYIERLMLGLFYWYKQDDTNIEVSIRTLLITLLYIERLEKLVEDFELTNRNIHKLFATLMLLGAKIAEDKIITNKYWEEICGIDTKVITKMESHLCFTLKLDLLPSPKDLVRIAKPFQDEI